MGDNQPFKMASIYIFAWAMSSMVISYPQSVTSWMTSMDAVINFTCPDAHVFSHWDSHWEDYYGDREWNMNCSNSLSQYEVELADCTWSDYIDQWQGYMEYACPEDGVVTGVYSEHDNSKEDRRWKLRCCREEGLVTHACAFTDFINGYGDDISYTVPAEHVIAGFTSLFDKEDRIWRFDVCKVARIEQP